MIMRTMSQPARPGRRFSVPGTCPIFARSAVSTSADELSLGTTIKNNAGTFGVGYAATQYFQMDFAYVSVFNRIFVSSAVRF